ncbi:MAG: alpha/beta hydrolase [Chloroflexota bacterium]
MSTEAQVIYETNISNSETLSEENASAITEFLQDCDNIASLRAFITPPTVDNLPQNLDIVAVDANGLDGVWFIPEDAQRDKVLMYIHGGGFVFQSVEIYTPYLMWLAHLSGYQIFAMNYRLAPEHPYPAALDDVENSYYWLLEEGYEAQSIALGGDSAGGNLVAALLLRLRDDEVEMPAAAWLYAPVLDQTRSTATEQDADRNNASTIPYDDVADCYLNETSPLNPEVSPLFANLTDLPPLLISVGTRDALLGASARFAQLARNENVDVTLDVWDGMWHVWSQEYPLLPESMRLHERLGIWLDSMMTE